MQTVEIKQQVEFTADPLTVYHTYIDSDIQSIVTLTEAEIDATVGGRFSAYDGYITGINTELVPGKWIVQQWRSHEEGWPADHYSEVVLELKPNNGGTLLTLTHSGIPIDKKDNMAQGWIQYYWEPMQAYFEDKLLGDSFDIGMEN